MYTVLRIYYWSMFVGIQRIEWKTNQPLSNDFVFLLMQALNQNHLGFVKIVISVILLENYFEKTKLLESIVEKT